MPDNGSETPGVLTDAPANHATWPRLYWHWWAPVVGPEYATLITRTRGRYLVALAVWLVYWTADAVVDYLIPGGKRFLEGPGWFVPFGGLALFVLGLFLLSISYQAPAQIVSDLRRSGLSVVSPPTIATPKLFERWCNRENVPLDQVVRAGSSGYAPVSWLGLSKQRASG